MCNIAGLIASQEALTRSTHSASPEDQAILVHSYNSALPQDKFSFIVFQIHILTKFPLGKISYTDCSLMSNKFYCAKLNTHKLMVHCVALV